MDLRARESRDEQLLHVSLYLPTERIASLAFLTYSNQSNHS